MKTKRFEKKLNINKKTISDLNNQSMNSVRGGLLYTHDECFSGTDCYQTQNPCDTRWKTCKICPAYP
jgi:hypothetical protein